MIEKKFKCPKCAEDVEFSGIPGEKKDVFCPYCGSKGRISFPMINQSQDYAIEVSNLKKENTQLPTKVKLNDIINNLDKQFYCFGIGTFLVVFYFVLYLFFK